MFIILHYSMVVLSSISPWIHRLLILKIKILLLSVCQEVHLSFIVTFKSMKILRSHVSINQLRMILLLKTVKTLKIFGIIMMLKITFKRQILSHINCFEARLAIRTVMIQLHFLHTFPFFFKDLTTMMNSFSVNFIIIFLITLSYSYISISGSFLIITNFVSFFFLFRILFKWL